ncbi:MAG TPA: aldehyde dehydrogenase family protein [Vicinamibacteria bacterium]|nr:aldehyde dehydrogenase family protein [Vicinamibacteria bacterium]
MSTTGERVTYATLAAGQTEDFRRKFDAALSAWRARLGRGHPHRIAGGPAAGGGPSFEDRNPADTRVVLGRFPAGTPDDVDRAVAAARLAAAGWRGRGWRGRVEILRRAALLIDERAFELSALVSLEAGKSRLEAMGDVTETADLVRYYCDQMEAGDGFDRPMARFSPREETRSVLRPYGVWGVISPFNFPAALAGGPAAGALVAGNTVVLKPSQETPLTAEALWQVFAEAGLPPAVLQVVQGPGATGEALARHPGVDGMLFTGSKAVGMALVGRFAREYPKPCITEMGGKNPAIVMPSADLEAAAEGVMRSAFGLQGQKCSACSRVYVHRDVKQRFLELLLERTATLPIGDPARHGVFLGPLIHERAYAAYQSHAAAARRDGRVLAGGSVLLDGELAHGYFVAPTVVDGLAQDHALFRDELFVPLVCVAEVASFAQALEWANRTEYGLTAGLFSREPDEVEAFLDRIEAGVVYVNRAAGATTGAWPGVQPFGGWKGSGSSGKASGGPHYVQQFMREQSRTIVHDGPPSGEGP